MSIYLLILLSVGARVILNPLANVFQKKLVMNGNHPLLVNFLIYLILCVATAFFSLSIDWRGLSPIFWQYSIIVGVLGAFANWFFVKSLDGGELSVIGPLNALKSVIGLLGALLLLQEVPNSFGVMGVIIIGIGGYVLLRKPDQRFSWRLLKGAAIQYRVWGMVLGAIEAIFIKKVILNSSSTIALISYCWFGALFSILLLAPLRTQAFSYSKLGTVKNLKLLILTAISLAVVQLGSNYALELLPVGYALSFFQLQSIFSIIFGYKIFKEREITQKIIGSTIMIFGAILVMVKG